MSKQHFSPRAPNSAAVTTMKSWLRAVGIEHDRSSQPGCDLAVTCSDGSVLDIAIVMDLNAPLPEGDCLTLEASEVASSKKDVALEAFYVVTETAGFGRPMPVDRGVAPTNKEIYGQDFFLAGARHREFRNAPNLPKELLEKYKVQVERGCRAFFARNAKLCLAHGYEVQDLQTFAWIWAHIYVHRFTRLETQQATGDDDQRLFTKYLRHRFGELFDLMLRYGRSTFVDQDTASIALMGTTFDVGDSAKHSVDPRFTRPAAPVEDSDKAEKRARKAATQVLRANLAALPHDDMVGRVRGVAANMNRDYSTRREARRFLQTHIKSCAHCIESGVTLPPLHGEGVDEGRHENVAAVDAPSTPESEQNLFG